MNFEALANQIDAIQHTLQAQAAHAVNLALTARNWLIGYYIVEFEQNGEDRAAYKRADRTQVSGVQTVVSGLSSTAKFSNTVS